MSVIGLGLDESRSIWLLVHLISLDDSDLLVATIREDVLRAGPRYVEISMLFLYSLRYFIES